MQQRLGRPVTSDVTDVSPGRLAWFAGLVVVMVAGLLSVPQVAAAAPKVPASPSGESVPTGVVPVRVPSPSGPEGRQSRPVVVWPDGGSAVVTVPDQPRSAADAASDSAPASLVVGSGKPGGLPVSIGPPVAGPAGEDLRTTADAARSVETGPSSVRVTVADQRLATRAGIHGVIFAVSRADGGSGNARARLEVDYSKFKFGYGGDYGGRLTVVRLPACALSTPELTQCQVRSHVAGVRNVVTRSVVTVDALPVTGEPAVADADEARRNGSEAPAVFALLASTSSGGGDWTATDLSPAYSWAAGTQGGEFSTSYPMQLPPSLGGPAPTVSLGYSSGLVDARTHSESGQASWVGEGWDLTAGGYVERSYRSCSEDEDTTGDLCWFSDNATLVLNGRSTRLIRDATSGVWKASDDSGSRIEKLKLTAWENGDDDNEYWRVTGQDGVQYFFGRNRRYAGDPQETQSTAVVPVFGNDSDEPCNVPGNPAGSWCLQAYRWNLDYVLDPHGNSMTYFYSEYVGYYGRRNNSAVSAYDIAKPLDHIDYGTRAGSEGSTDAPVQVWFGKEERCVEPCDTAEDFPDVPLDKLCRSSTSCPDTVSPVFFNPYRLSEISTRVFNQQADDYRDVDHWTLTHAYPPSGDNVAPFDGEDDTNPNLWLDAITHTGALPDGVTEASEPATEFDGTPMANKVTWGPGAGPPYMHWRLTKIRNNVGGETRITYSDEECLSGGLIPAFDANPNRCYSPKYAPAGSTGEPDWELFHKYVVTEVIEDDLTGGSDEEIWSYTYSTDTTNDPTLWRHDEEETTELGDRTWSQWLGYPKVTTTHGPAAGPKTTSTTVYHRGLNGDARFTSDQTARVWGARRAAIMTPLTTPPGVAGRTATLAGSNSGVGSRCLEPNGATNGSPVRAVTCNGSLNQNWHRFDDDTWRHDDTHKCLDPTGPANGSAVQLWDCSGGIDQKWRTQSDGTLMNLDSDRCVGIPNFATASGVAVTVQDCTGGWNQVWTPTGTYGLANTQSRRCADLWADGTTNGTHVVTWVCNNDANQLWQPQSNNTWRNPISNRCLDIVGSGTANGTLVQLWDCTGAANQIWLAQTDGSLKNPASNRCLDTGANPASQQRLRIADCNPASITQRWLAGIPDLDGLNGSVAEARTLNGTTEVGTTYNEYTVTQTGARPTADGTGQTLTALMTLPTITRDRAMKADGTWRWTESHTAYDSYGLPTQARDLADTAVTSDDICTTISYARHTTKYLIGFASQQITRAGAGCAAGDVRLAESRTFYDGSTTLGAAPTVGLATKSQTLVSTGPDAWASSEAGFDSNGRAISSVDARGKTTTTAYSPAAGGPVLQVTVTNPLGHVNTSTLDGHRGLPVSTTDANGRVTTARYDALGRLIKVWRPGTSTTGTPDLEYGYTLSNTSANVITTTRRGPTGNQIRSYQLFDGRLRIRQTQHPAPVAHGGRIISDTAYNDRGLVVKTSSLHAAGAPSGSLASFSDSDVPTQNRYSHDLLDRVTSDQLWSSGVLKRQSSYIHGGLTEKTRIPAVGGAERVEWDALGRAVRLHHYPTGTATGTPETISYGYDRVGNLVQVTDAVGNVTTYTYDVAGRRTGTDDPDTGESTTEYNAAGDVLSATDGRGQKVSFAYDWLGRTTERWAGDVGAGSQLASFSYDSLAKGFPTSATRYEGGAQYVVAISGYTTDYQPTGQTWSIPLAEGALAGTYSMSTTYNQHTGSLASISYPAAHGLPAETVTYGYDALNYPTTVTGLQTYVASTGYTELGQLAQRVYGQAGPGQLTRDYTWDPGSGRLASITGKVPNPAAPGSLKTVQNDSFTYNATGDVTAIRDNTDGQTQCYGYDPQHRLTEAWTTLGACSTAPTAAGVATSGKHPYWDSWTFDAAGRRVSDIRRTATTNTSRGYTYPAAGADRPHAMTSVTKTGSQTGTDSFTYDNGGNMATRTVAGQTTDFTFDVEGRNSRTVVHATGGDQETRHLHDAGGKLLVRREPGKTTLHIGEQEFTLTGTTVSCQRYYSVGATVAVRTAAGVTWIAADHQGSANLAVNQATGQVDKRWYTPYGADRAGATGWPTDRGFLGAPTNDSTGLVHLGAREYDPTHGVFISPDPLVRWSSPQSLNAYDYANASPVTASDPTGLDPDGPDPVRGIAGNHGDAHQVAVWLRIQRIMELYPKATDIYGSPINRPGADIICWDCEDGKILIWEVKPRDGENVDLAASVTKVADDPVAKRTGREVVIGGPLGEEQRGYASGVKQYVTVYSTETPGREEYETEQDDDKNPAKRAEWTAWRRAAEDVIDARKQPKVPEFAQTEAQKEQYRRRHLEKEPGSEHPQDIADHARDPRPKDPGAVVGGSFVGDVVLFTAAIFGGLVVCRLICRGGSRSGSKSGGNGSKSGGNSTKSNKQTKPNGSTGSTSTGPVRQLATAGAGRMQFV